MKFDCNFILSAPSLMFVFIFLITIDMLNGMVVNKRNIAPENEMEGFVNPANQIQSKYDEYPMVVPKRNAMLLDRLMIALHNALEDERRGKSRISDMYHGGRSGYNFKFDRIAYNNEPVVWTITDGDNAELNEGLPMEPSEMDTRDLKMSTGRSNNPDNLMAKSFQRRAHDDTTSGSAAGTGRRDSGRMYWRCYFNAVTCF